MQIDALNSLCAQAETLLAISSMMLIIMAMVAFVLSFFINEKDRKKWHFVLIALVGIAVLALIIYLFVPALFQMFNSTSSPLICRT